MKDKSLIIEIDNNQYSHFMHLAKMNNYKFVNNTNYSYIISDKEVWCNFVFDFKKINKETLKELKTNIINKNIPDKIIGNLIIQDGYEEFLFSEFFTKTIANDGMTLEKNNFKYKRINDEIKIIKCSSMTELLKWSKLVVTYLFNNYSEKNVSDFAQMIFPCLKQDNYSAYLGFYNNEPVAASACYFINNAGGIYFVAVSEKYRKMGFGYEITAKCIIDGINIGCNSYILHATDTGKYVYSKLGFKSVGIKNRYKLKLD